MHIHGSLYRRAYLLFPSQGASWLGLPTQTFLNGNWTDHPLLCIRFQRLGKLGYKSHQLSNHSLDAYQRIAYRYLHCGWRRPFSCIDSQVNLQFWRQWPRCTDEFNV